ncbi:M50 family metallopeptidase [Eubacteriales bacterium OttesenSCG-928-K08]|nr:M50 family metallopeptidase [Eubacteriales bacterium OttesenSCG-928-K08]
MGLLKEIALAFLALSLHEFSHAIVAHALGYGVDSVELLPFGGVAKLSKQTRSPLADFLIAASGPLCSLSIAGGVAVALLYWPNLPLDYFLRANMILALFNLLPVLPLDGGRMTRAVLSKAIRLRTATLITAWAGIVLGAVLLGFAVYLAMLGAFNPFLWMMGVFLPLCALKEMRTLPQAQVTSILQRRETLARGEPIAMRQFVVQKNMQAYIALRQLSASVYNLLLIVDDDLRVIGQLDEGRLMEGIAQKGQEVTVGELI